MRIAADVAVIGGGSSGCAIAGRLAEAGVRVVVIEAGPDYGPFSSGSWPADLLNAHAIAASHDWGYGSGPVPKRTPWSFERARVLGGCSAHNGAIAAVGHANDYDSWKIGGWSTDELRPIFATVLEKMRVRTYEESEVGPFHALCLNAARAVGWTMAEDLCDLDANASFGRESVNIVDKVRWNAAFAYLDPVRTRTNLQIVDKVLVDRVTDGPTSASVFGSREGRPFQVDADRVVLCAGVYGTPAILQRSGVGDPTRLRAVGITAVHELRGVGANLHDHPMVHSDRQVGPQLQTWLDEAAQSNSLPEEQTLGKAVSSQAQDGIYDLHLFPVCASTQTVLTGGSALVEVAAMTPLSRGRIDVLSPDPDIAPRIDHGYLSDVEGHDLAVLRDGLVLAEELLNQTALASVLGEPVTDVSTDEAIRRSVAHYYHPVGTCKMGSDRTGDSVCDSHGRVHGMQRVFVGDVSLMPQIPRANTNIPAVVIGEKIAAYLQHC
jgi:choline dehydrogenase